MAARARLPPVARLRVGVRALGPPRVPALEAPVLLAAVAVAHVVRLADLPPAVLLTVPGCSGAS